MSKARRLTPFLGLDLHFGRIWRVWAGFWESPLQYLALQRRPARAARHECARHSTLVVHCQVYRLRHRGPTLRNIDLIIAIGDVWYGDVELVEPYEAARQSRLGSVAGVDPNDACGG
jgi:hypothetical protein